MSRSVASTSMSICAPSPCTGPPMSRASWRVSSFNSSRVIGGGKSSSSSSANSMVSTTTKSCQSMLAIASLSFSKSSSICCFLVSSAFSHSILLRHFSSMVSLPMYVFSILSVTSFGGIRTLEYVSAKAVKKLKSECVGFKKLNCGFMCSLLVRPERKPFPLRATYWAVSLITSRSIAAMPSETGIVNNCASGSTSSACFASAFATSSFFSSSTGSSAT
mmetsp:Transcript_6927/g.25532  ORF Transcript_6927/g.25532 Transcript_6927/m.25532 type:complete len:219 (-) Transcript_6927:496-1152(-)